MSIFNVALEEGIRRIMPEVNAAILNKKLPKNLRRQFIQAKRAMENRPKGGKENGK